MENINYAQVLADYMLEHEVSAESAIESILEDFAEQLDRATLDAQEIVDEENQNAREFEEEYLEGLKGK